MSHFAMGALLDWRPVEAGEVVAFPNNEAAGFRLVEFNIMSDRMVAINAVAADEAVWLVGVGVGFVTCKFTAAEDVGVYWSGDPSAVVYMRTRNEPQVISESEEVSFTSIEPRRVDGNAEVKRLVQIMNHNMRVREQALRSEFEARLAERPLIEPEAMADDPPPG